MYNIFIPLLYNKRGMPSCDPILQSIGCFRVCVCGLKDQCFPFPYFACQALCIFYPISAVPGALTLQGPIITPFNLTLLSPK